tara:strand:+ start:412 stop:2433 length:2022 start_codon:yes stop_codon:yes gene_type:complete
MIPILSGNVASALPTGYEVANSCRFNRADNPNMTKTPSSSGSLRKWTWSCWVKRGTISNGSQTMFNGITGSNNTQLRFDSDDTINFYQYSGGYTARLATNAKYRDPSAWIHVVAHWDTDNSTAGDRMKLFVNKTEVTSFAADVNPALNLDSYWNASGTAMYVGDKGDGAEEMDGYLAEMCFINNANLAPTEFGKFSEDSPNIWMPKDVSELTFGTNGFYLNFEKDETSTNFIDRSSSARAITVTGNVNHSVTQAKFNDSSIYFDGTNDSLDIADSSDFDFGTGNFTFEFWCYKTGSGKMAIFETRPNGGNDHGFNLEFNASDKFEWYDASISGTLPRDPSAISLNTWTHYACVRNGTTFTMYKNGTSVGTPLTSDSSSQASDGTPTIGESSAGDNDFQGYLDEIRLSSTARYTGNFTAPTSPFTSDSDTVLLIQSNASNKIGADVSGQGNHFVSSNITSEDQSTDTCTNNFCTLNPLAPYSNTTYSEGNCIASGSASAWQVATGTIGVSQGKWYWEVLFVGGTVGNYHAGVRDQTADDYTGNHNQNGTTTFYNGDGGEVFKGGLDVFTTANYGTMNGSTDVLGVALDMDNKQISFYKNGSAIVTNFALHTPCDLVFPVTAQHGSSQVSKYNFGGSPSFTISSGNSDGNGYGNFEYAVPSGYYSLCTKNLAEYG